MQMSLLSLYLDNLFKNGCILAQVEGRINLQRSVPFVVHSRVGLNSMDFGSTGVSNGVLNAVEARIIRQTWSNNAA